MNKRNGLLTAMFIFILTGVLFMGDIKFNTDFDDIHLSNSKDLEAYQKIQSYFPKQDQGALIILEKSDGFTTLNDFKWVDTLTKKIESYPEVLGVSSITNLKIPKKGPFQVYLDAFLKLDSEAAFKNWQENFSDFEDVNQKFISKNQAFLLIYINSIEGLSQSHIQELALSQTSEIQIYVNQKNLIEDKLQEEWIYETVLIAGICVLLILLSFYWLTRSWETLGLIIFMIAFNMAGVILFMVGLNIQFNLHMIALPCLIIIFSFTDILHILYHHSILIAENLSVSELHLKLKTNLKSALFLTSFSNLFGFILFLFLSSNVLLSELAILAIFTVTIAYLSGRYLVIPLLKNEKPLLDLRRIEGIQHFFNRGTKNLKFSKKAVFIPLIILNLVLVGLVYNGFKIDSSKNAFTTENAELKRSQEILTNHFYGAKSLEILIDYRDSSAVWDLSNLKLIKELEADLKEHFSTKYIVSPLTIVKRYNRFLLNGNPNAYTLPNKISEDTKTALDGSYEMLGGGQVIAPDHSIGRILLGLDDDGLASSLKTYEEVKKLLNQPKYSGLNLSLSGKSPLADYGTYAFTNNLIIAWLIGLLLSALALSFYLKSFLKGTVIFLVNFMPILLVVYLMPLFGLKINPQSLFLLTILTGLCVDDSIYLILNRVKKRAALSFYPIVVTSVVLAAGFISFAFSSYTFLSPFAWLFVIGIGWAFLLDVFVLPLFMFNSEEIDE